MATVPLSGTNIRLLSGIPFNNDYKNTRWFTSKATQTSYFTSKTPVHSMVEANFQRIEGKHIIAVNKSTDALWNAGYVMFQNAHYNNKWFYGFITKLEYKQRNNTHVHFEIDVLQTWMFEMKFKPSYVVREHRKLWNSDGTPVINTVDEELNYGTEYETVDVSSYSHMGGYKWMVIVTKTPLEGEDGVGVKTRGSIVGTPQPLSYYIAPFTDDARPVKVLLKTGKDVAITTPTKILDALYKGDKEVNNVVSIFVTDYIGMPSTISYGGGNTPDVITFPKNENEFSEAWIGSGFDQASLLYVNKMTYFEPYKFVLGQSKYDGFTNVTESKLLMYPYAMTVLDDFRGNRVTYKNEYIKSKELSIIMKGSLGLSNKVTYAVETYNYSGASHSADKFSNEFALISNPANDIPILNDFLAAFLQGNRNSIETQKSSIVWNGVMGAIGSSIGAGASAASGNAIGAVAGTTDIVKGAGNSVLEMQSIQSKIKDIDNIPPQITKMGSNTAYDFGNRYNGLYVMKKHIKHEYRMILNDFFKMFGYKTNEVKIPNFRTRMNWNYVQTLNCNILGDFNNEDIAELKAIFDNGITLWHTDDVGNYDLTNEVR